MAAPAHRVRFYTDPQTGDRALVSVQCICHGFDLAANRALPVCQCPTQPLVYPKQSIVKLQ